MRLKIMYLDGNVKEQAIERLFTINTIYEGTYLYYETPSDLRGKGQSIPLSEIKCWEVEAMMPSGSQGLKL